MCKNMAAWCGFCGEGELELSINIILLMLPLPMGTKNDGAHKVIIKLGASNCGNKFCKIIFYMIFVKYTYHLLI